ncbi:uncharacterized protein LOC18008157 [Eutrema salsugineum]|nr:uncharacterized protein LOC18008157 [Eutrema salsugineum]
MELFTRSSAVRLRSCHEKYLFAVDDEKAVRQSSDGTSRQSVWTVEMVPRKPDFIRLKSCYGKYLTASESSFLLGMTGEKVIQTPPFRQAEHESDWEPIRDGLPVKLMSWNGKYLRGNGGSPSWKNSVTHDREPSTSTTKKWILWTVEVVENPEKVSFADRFSSPASSFKSSVSDESTHDSPVKKLQTFGSFESIGSDPGSMASVSSSKLMFTPSLSGTLSPKPIEVCLNSHIFMKHVIKNFFFFRENATGHKVVQSRRIRTGEPAGEWEPVKEGLRVKLRSRNGGNYLRANGGVPPWRNSVTHDSPNRSATQSWVVWDVDVVEIMERSHGTG